FVDSIFTNRVGRVKNKLKPWLKAMCCIPLEQDAAFVAAMEHVLSVYQRPYDQRFLVVNMDEQPIQLVAHSRVSLPMRPGSVAKVDYEYVREGMCNAFMFVEPLGH
ncbi:MAG: IS630 family transposase, partial [Planctomycetales bacterium]|nr:IS630 family transposase [Planctomycetales bacterium]